MRRGTGWSPLAVTWLGYGPVAKGWNGSTASARGPKAGVAVALDARVVGNVGRGVFREGVGSVMVCVTNGNEVTRPSLSRLVIKVLSVCQSVCSSPNERGNLTPVVPGALLMVVDGTCVVVTSGEASAMGSACTELEHSRDNAIARGVNTPFERAMMMMERKRI